MLTDMENTEREESSGSSQTRRRKNSDKSPPNSPKNSSPAPVAAGGDSPEPKLSSLNFLLTLLQSDLGEIKDKGGTVRMCADPNGLIIQLPNVAICQNHKMMHFGTACPMC
jgi:hypothetical protein